MGICVSFCHRRRILYFIHQDCSLVACRYADPVAHGKCESCCHKRGDLCYLTNARLPNSGGCCHYIVELVRGEQVIGLEQVRLLEPSPGQSVAGVLDDYYIDTYVQFNGKVLLDPDGLPLPETYGLGTDKLLKLW